MLFFGNNDGIRGLFFVKSKHILLDIQVQYNLLTKVTPDEYINIKIKRDIYGLK